MRIELGNLTGAGVPAADRLWSLSAALAHLRGFVSDKAGELGKSAALSIACPNLLVAPILVDSLTPALVQLLRNAIEHGVERPVDRLVAGKPLTARIAVAVTAKPDHLLLEVSDDGAGIDPAAVVTAAFAAGAISQEAGTTADPMTLLHHRGVTLAGGDAARRGNGLKRAGQRLRAVGGTIAIHSEKGLGASATITIPLSRIGTVIVPGQALLDEGVPVQARR